MYNVLSLFDGISCGQLALQKAGVTIKNYYASEIEKSAIAVTQKHFPDTTQLGDVRDIRIPDADILIGGSPCQGFSIAGNRLNFDDPRSALFFEFVRVWKELNPKYFFLENVKMAKPIQNEISNILGCEPVLVNSSLVSAQSRKRLYWTNIPHNLPMVDSPLTVGDICETTVDDKYFVEPKRAVTILDNEVQARKIGYIGSDSQGNRIYSIQGKSVTLTANGGGLGAKTGLYAFPCLTPSRENKRQNGPRFRADGSKSFTVTCQDRHGVLTPHGIRRLTPLECERLQTLPDHYTQGYSDSKRYQMIGNGWTVSLVSKFFEGLK